ncbi:polar growth protein [Tulasnella sp. JGI-2019a]|nr:polar growth protein [Tulasnella sp. JGI-2019a]
MTATMTDIQQAIDQLAVNRAGGDNNSRHTFSFISHSEDSEHGTEHGQDGEYDSPGGFHGRHKKLLENAERANSRPQSGSPRRLAPPIPVDMSDESDADDGDGDDHIHPLPTGSESTSVPPTAKASDFPIHNGMNGNRSHINESEALSPISPGTMEHFNHLSINSPPEGMSPARAASDLDPYGRHTPSIKGTPPQSPVALPHNLPQPRGRESPLVTTLNQSHHTGSTGSLPVPSPPGAFVEDPKLYSDPEHGHEKQRQVATQPIVEDFNTEPKPHLVVSEPTLATEPEPTPRALTPTAPSPKPSPALHILASQPISHTPPATSPAMSHFGDAMRQALPMSHPITPPTYAPSPPPDQYAQPYRTITPILPTPLSTRFSIPQSAATTASFPLPTIFPSHSMSQSPSQRESMNAPSPLRSNPAEWSVEQVVEWLRSKKFDASVVDKFIENDITGDVLLEMDVNMLKELDIPAFGKRMRIANAIGELRRQGSNSRPSSPNNGRNLTDQSYNTSSSMASASVPNMSGLSDTFHAGPLSNGNMQQYLQHQQYQQPLPVAMPQPQMGLGLPSAMMYGSSSGPVLGMPTAGHGRNLSIGSTAPSANMMTLDTSGMSDSERYSSISGQLPPRQYQGGMNPYRPASTDSWTPNPNSAPPQQPTHSVNGSIGKPANGSITTENHIRSRSEAGILLAGSASVTGSTGASVNGDRDHDSPVTKGGRAGSLRGKPSLSPQEPPARWTFGQQQNASGSLRGVPGIVEEKEEIELDKPAPSETSAYEVERASMSETEATTGTKPGLKKRMSTRKAVRVAESSPVTAASDSKSDHSHHSTPVSSIPPSPSVKGSMFGGSKKNKAATAEAEGTASGTSSARNSRGGAGDRMSFFGGTLGRSRKPAPQSGDFSDTSATVSSNAEKTHRSLSRLYLGGSTRKASATGRGPASAIVAPGETSQKESKSLMPSSPLEPNASGSVIRKPRPASSPPTPRGPSGAAVGDAARPRPPAADVELKPGMTALDQIGAADHSGWMRKRGDRYNAWKLRYFALKGPHLYYVKALSETKIKGYINIVGYKVVADENVYPGRYGFRIVHETEKTHYFSSVEQQVVREWMKALMKATIGRDYNRPVVSSCNIPTIPLTVAQAMNPAPRPPSPSARDATQKLNRRDNVNQLSSRDALVLMGMAGEPDSTDKARLDSFFKDHTGATHGANGAALPPPRPSRDLRKVPSFQNDTDNSAADMELINWINSNLPSDAPLATDLSTSLSSGLVMYRLAESIKGVPTDVPDSAFPLNGEPEKLEGLFKLFDFLLDNDVKIGSVSINDVRLGHKDKIAQLVRSLKAWQEKRENLGRNMQRQPMSAGPWMAV